MTTGTKLGMKKPFPVPGQKKREAAPEATPPTTASAGKKPKPPAQPKVKEVTDDDLEELVGDMDNVKIPAPKNPTQPLSAADTMEDDDAEYEEEEGEDYDVYDEEEEEEEVEDDGEEEVGEEYEEEAEEEAPAPAPEPSSADKPRRGRPPKEKPAEDPNAPKPRRGRPPKDRSAEAETPVAEKTQTLGELGYAAQRKQRAAEAAAPKVETPPPNGKPAQAAKPSTAPANVEASSEGLAALQESHRMLAQQVAALSKEVAQLRKESVNRKSEGDIPYAKYEPSEQAQKAQFEAQVSGFGKTIANGLRALAAVMEG